jgi:diguanylate cyclase (GGDEF)-like protein/PAS domain S-box-containing protein
MNLFIVLSIISFQISFFLTVFSHQIKPMLKLHKFFIICSFLIMLWNIASIFMFNANYADTYMFWQPVRFIIHIVLFVLIFYFTILLTRNEKNKYIKYVFYFSIIIAAAIIITRIFGLLTFDTLMQSKYGFIEIKEKININSIIYTVWSTFIFVFSLIIIKQWGNKTSLLKERKQAGLIFYSGILLISIGAIINLYLPVFIKSFLPPSGHLITSMYLVVVYVAIIRFKFLQLTPNIVMDEIMTKVHDLIIILDDNFDILFLNDMFVSLTGYKKNEFTGKNITEYMSIFFFPNNNDDEPWEDNASFETTIRTKHKEEIPVNLFLKRIKDKYDDINGYVILAQDIRQTKFLEKEILERNKVERNLEFLIYHDSLTNVFNRNAFDKKLLELSENPPISVGFIICDIDNLKSTNDRFGNTNGDILIKETALALNKSIFYTKDTYRIAGDEFAVMLINKNDEYAEKVLNTIENSIKKYNDLNSDLPLSISIGYAVDTSSNIDINEVFKKAEQNMYTNKNEKI